MDVSGDRRRGGGEREGLVMRGLVVVRGMVWWPPFSCSSCFGDTRLCNWARHSADRRSYRIVHGASGGIQ